MSLLDSSPSPYNDRDESFIKKNDFIDSESVDIKMDFADY